MSKFTNEKLIQQEINRLAVIIASNKYDYEMARLQGKPLAYRMVIAESICSAEYQKRCLEFHDYAKLPYNIKLLFNQPKEKK